MLFRDQIIRLTDQVSTDFIKNIRAVPEDKLTWSVLDAGRTPLDLFQEIAQAATYGIPMLQNRACPPFNPEDWGKLVAERQAWDTLDKCEAALKTNLEAWYATIREFPESDMSIEIDLPFVEGLRQSMADIMAYPYWNTSYHLGQLCFIQILYGDKEMR
jgi:hypothetical protein